MSFGLAEHFKGDNRIRIIRSHFDLLRNGGISFISVPNKFNLSYRIYKFIAEAAGKWSVGEEYPFSRWELANIIKEIGIENYTFFGDSIYSSLNFINPMELSKKIFNIKKNFDLDLIKKERGSKLDQYFSYALVLCGKKQITQL